MRHIYRWSAIACRRSAIALAIVALVANGATHNGHAAQVQAVPASSAQTSVSPLRIAKNVKLSLDLETPINSATTRQGSKVLFRTRHDVMDGKRIAIPQGTLIEGSVDVVKPAFVNGKSKRAEIQVRIGVVPLVGGQEVRLATDTVKLTVEDLGGQSSIKEIALSAVKGGLLASTMGALWGGKRTMVIMASGAAAGGVTGVRVSRTKGSEVDLPQGSIFETHTTRRIQIPIGAKFEGPPTASRSASVHLPVATDFGAGIAAEPVAAARVNAPLGASRDWEGDSGTASSSSASPSVSAGASSAISSNRSPGSPTLESVPLDSQPETVPATVSASDTTSAGPPAEYKLTIDVNLVPVDAVVRDRNGKSMAGLRKEDFRLFEDGVERQILSLSRDETPLAVALVIDRSASVASLMPVIQTAAFDALQQLKRDDSVCLFAFANDTVLLERLTTDRRRVANRIGQIQGSGGTRILDAVEEALEYLRRAAPDKRRVVLLISDNVEGPSRVDVGEVTRRALESESVLYSIKLNQSTALLGLPIPSIPAISTSRSNPVPIVAKATGGEVFDSDSSSLTRSLAEAISRLKLRYTLGFEPLGKTPGRYHNIMVRLADRFGRPNADYSVHARAGYYE